MYADHAATAFPTLFSGIVQGSIASEWHANAGGAHALAKKAHSALNAAHSTICDALKASPHSRLVTTSGGTEGSNLVLQGHVWDFIVTIATEHSATANTARYLLPSLGMGMHVSNDAFNITKVLM
jgi:cysteine sulfinate desulfinase/cysteine desulfurase-like protein